jgi:asparagine synthase (glutamine-hydrolysing)
MCGIAGFWQARSSGDVLAKLAHAMSKPLVHRGPDDSGRWLDPDAGVALAHRRLSILDLSPAGHQPMLSASGRWVIVFNGEIYNHLDLRAELAASDHSPSWRGHADTETLLACIDAWGVESTLRRCVGMFAFALWDRDGRSLWLARDRAGEKPLYYGWQGDVFLFGSEMKALQAHPAFRGAVDRGALALLLRHNYVPGPYSIYQGIHKLPPGTWLKLAAGQRDAEPIAYWSLREVAEQGAAHPFEGSDAEAVDRLGLLLGNSIRGQMLSDVPLGALLSGGLDSTLVASLMQANSMQPIRTFTIGFHERDYDEAAHARAVAGHLGTQHTEMRLSSNDALALIPAMPAMYDEPFADSSQLPTHLVMKLAREQVTVALSGDGGDEFFGGYNRYRFLPRVWSTLGPIPANLRSWGLWLAASLPDVVGRIARTHQTAEKIAKVRRLFDGATSGIDDMYVRLVSEWPDPARLVVQGRMPDNRLDDRGAWPRLVDPVARMMALDAMTYLPDDILVKVDRASMAVSLETRAPFLDRDVMAFAWRLPMSMKIRDGRGKWVLRQLLDRYVPRALIERPKMGFGIPLDAWLRGPLREWAEALLAEDRLCREGFFDPAPIRRAWREHLSGRHDRQHHLWSVLMFQAWLESNPASA